MLEFISNLFIIFTKYMYLTCNTVCDNIDWRKTTYYEIELFFVSAALIFEKCTRHSKCPANSGCRPSGCDGYTCRCDVNFVYSDDRSHCIPGMTYMYTYLCLSIIICVISSFLSFLFNLQCQSAVYRV